MNKKSIEVQISSDADYDRLVAELYIDGRFACLVSQEDGPEHLLIEFPPAVPVCSNEIIKFGVDEFLQGVRQARSELVKGIH